MLPPRPHSQVGMECPMLQGRGSRVEAVPATPARGPDSPWALELAPAGQTGCGYWPGGSLEAWRCRPIAVLNGMQDLLCSGFSGATRP